MENKPEPTIENVFEEMSKLFEAIQSRKGPIKMTPDLAADIEKLKTLTAMFKEDSQDLFNLLDIDIKSLQQEVMGSDKIRSSDKQLIKQAKDIEIEARLIKLALTKNKDKQRRHSPQQGSDQRKMKQRKKLFKTIGGDQKWIPL